MILNDSNGTVLSEGNVVTYSVFDETQSLQSIKPFHPYLKDSRIVIGRYKDILELRWQFGDGFKCANIVTLDEETAKVLIVIDSDSD